MPDWDDNPNSESRHNGTLDGIGEQEDDSARISLFQSIRDDQNPFASRSFQGSVGQPEPDMPHQSSGLHREYHPHLTGTLEYISLWALSYIVAGNICDEFGLDLPPGTPPTLRESSPSLRPNNWSPYSNRVEFEVADFLFRKVQMSGGNINALLSFWATTLAPFNAHPPFRNHKDLYKKIDSTELGDIPWQSYLLSYTTGARPEPQQGEAPSWMLSEYEVWFRDPRVLVHNLILNPDFKNEFDYKVFREYDADGDRRYHDFMSGKWTWKQAVYFCSSSLMDTFY